MGFTARGSSSLPFGTIPFNPNGLPAAGNPQASTMRPAWGFPFQPLAHPAGDPLQYLNPLPAAGNPQASTMRPAWGFPFQPLAHIHLAQRISPCAEHPGAEHPFGWPGRVWPISKNNATGRHRPCGSPVRRRGIFAPRWHSDPGAIVIPGPPASLPHLAVAAHVANRGPR